jgi:hypothetical protein
MLPHLISRPTVSFPICFTPSLAPGKVAAQRIGGFVSLLIATGLTNREMADRLVVTERVATEGWSVLSLPALGAGHQSNRVNGLGSLWRG